MRHPAGNISHRRHCVNALCARLAGKLVEIGDPIVYRPGCSRLQGDLIAAPGLDDRVGVYVVMEALRRVSKGKLRCGVFAVSTVQEEIGLRGARTSAFGIDPHAGIAVDVTHATDYPGADARQTGEVKLQAGPAVAKGANINPPLREIIVKAAAANKAKSISRKSKTLPDGRGFVFGSGCGAGFFCVPPVGGTTGGCNAPVVGQMKRFASGGPLSLCRQRKRGKKTARSSAARG